MLVGARLRHAPQRGYVLMAEAWATAMDDIVIAIMIEKTGAMDNLEKFSLRRGYGAVRPSDYSISYGKPGQADRRRYWTPERMVEMALKKALHPG